MSSYPPSVDRFLHRLARPLLGIACICLASLHVQAQVPASLAELVLGASKRPIVDAQWEGELFHTIAVFSAEPYLAWPEAKRNSKSPAYDREATRLWLRRIGAALGHRDFEPFYQENFTWRGCEVWKYGLARAGIVLHDARVEIHWRGRNLVGLVNAVPLPLLAPAEPGADVARDGSVVYFAERRPTGYAPVLTRVRATQRGGLLVTTVGTQTTVSSNPISDFSLVDADIFKEWNVPEGDFPDQIDVDSTGKIWFSQPNDDYLTRFDPQTETFQQYPTTGGSGPDGMIVDSQDQVWTGLYLSGGLGKFLPSSGTHTAYAAPYSPAAMAIPVQSSQGTIWVTDHENNRISEFDPITATWLGSYLIPTSASWVVQGSEDPTQFVIYYTCYDANKLAYKPLGQPIQETNALPYGPAFPVWSNGKVYYSLWNDRYLGEYDPQTGQHTRYTFPVADEWGGPIGATSDGRIVVGTRNAGYIMVFHPSTATFSHYKIPTSHQFNLKDGLTIGIHGEVWFTETGVNKLARLWIH